MVVPQEGIEKAVYAMVKWVVSHYLHNRKAPLDELVPDKGALKSLEGELVTLSKAEDGLDIKERQQCVDQFRSCPELPFCFSLVA